MKKLQELRKSRKGFTLVEIIVVLVILAILAAFTIPAMLGFVNDARSKAYIAEAREVYVAAQSTATQYIGTKDKSAAQVETALKAYTKGTDPADASIGTSLYQMIDNDVSTDSGQKPITAVTVDPTSGKITAMTYVIKKGTATYTMTYNQNGWTTTQS